MHPKAPTPRQLSPFSRVFPAAVQHPDDFFDREQPLEEVLHTLHIRARQPIVLQGERGIGKTSLLLRVERALAQDQWGEWRWLAFYIPPGRLDRWEHFAWELLDGLDMVLSVLPDLPTPGALDTQGRPLTFNHLVRLVNRLMAPALNKNANLGVVVMMDEIDKGGVHPDVLEKILASIHYLVEKTDLPLFFMMTIIARNLPEPAWGSPLPAKLIRLTPLDATSQAELVTTLARHEGWRFPEEALCRWVDDWSGGHPYLMKLLLAAMLRVQKALPAAEELRWQPDLFLQRALEMEEAGQLLEDVYTRFFSDEEKAVMLALAERWPQGIEGRELDPWQEPFIRALWGLVERGYVSQERGVFSLRMGFWAKWLRAWRLWPLERAAHPLPGLHGPELPQGLCVVRSTQRVYVDGREVEGLGGYPMRALLYLAEHAGQVVSRDELVRAIYPDEFHAATEQQIDVIISRIRKALGDKRPYRFLITLRGRGFRLEKVTVLDVLPSSDQSP